jgi:large subunit ribosomal protein L29
MKVDELRELEEDQLGDRLRAARRELYELRFKHAVGQLENSSQISKVRHDIARIMTVISERELGIVVHAHAPAPEAETAQAPVAVADRDEGFEPEEVAELASPPRGEVARSAVGGEAEAEAEAPKPKRGRKAKTEETS